MIKPCIIGLGYVGLPILINLSKKYKCIGFDNNSQRINDLSKGKDTFNEFKKKTLLNKSIKYTNSLKIIKNFNLYIVTVPTPILKNKTPDLKHLKNVCNNLSCITNKFLFITIQTFIC